MHARQNRRAWDDMAAWFEKHHRADLEQQGGMIWAFFPERELRLLGDVRGKDVLELGCGAARWAVALARAGARVTGLDLSPRRLDQARAQIARAGVDVALVEASAEDVPLPDRSFDLIFCDVGAMTFADPYRTVPEAARLLRPGGRLTFTTSSPLSKLFWNERTSRIEKRLQRPYFGLHRIKVGNTFEFQLPYGEWVRLFGEHGLVVEQLIERAVPPRTRSGFLTPAEARWARHWPIISIWSVRKREGPRRGARRSPRSSPSKAQA